MPLPPAPSRKAARVPTEAFEVKASRKAVASAKTQVESRASVDELVTASELLASPALTAAASPAPKPARKTVARKKAAAVTTAVDLAPAEPVSTVAELAPVVAEVALPDRKSVV